MNINDIEKIDFDSTGDMLKDIFKRQLELEDKYTPIEGKYKPKEVNIHTKEGQHWLKTFAWFITEELGEAMNCLKNKLWKQSEIRTDVNHYMEEIADALHFFIALCIYSGLDADKLYNLYFKKSEVNKFRQRSKY